MTKMIEINEVNSTRLINQLITHAKSARGGNHSSGNKTFEDYDPAGQPNTYYDGRVYRDSHKFWEGTSTTKHTSQHPFNTSCDTRGQLDALLRTILYQGKNALITYNSFMELKFGNKFHILC